MRIENINNTAFSLLEILLAAVIFIISVAGVFTTLSAVRAPVLAKENQLAETIFDKQVNDTLYSQVTNASYYSPCSSLTACPNFDLEIGIHVVPMASTSLKWPSGLTPNPSSSLTYTVCCADGSGGGCIAPTDPTCGNNPNIAHEVVLNINWPSNP